MKIYLDAGVEERARRRVGELQEKGETADFEEIKKMILERDYNDMHRAHSPLKGGRCGFSGFDRHGH